ncbi:MAG TPA: hypothetical protein VFB02_27435 [Bradyrhizobium sp.]|jgi:hypothetical protein|nr:hypothetical protein [Bradyrhizobium sp.]
MSTRTIGIGAAILVLVAIAAVILPRTGTRISELFTKSANERVAEGFEAVKGIGPVSDDLKIALSSLSQSVQGAHKPPIQAGGH